MLASVHPPEATHLISSLVAGFCNSCGRIRLESRPQIGGSSRQSTMPCRGSSPTTCFRGRHRAGRSSPRVRLRSLKALRSVSIPCLNRKLSDPCSSSTVDEEFEDVATQVLNRTCAMVNKYRRLLMVEAEVGAQTGVSFLTRRVLTVYSSPQRSSPSSEMVMIDRTFNQEERSTLTQDKRLVLVDPGRTKQESRRSTSLQERFL